LLSSANIAAIKQLTPSKHSGVLKPSKFVSGLRLSRIFHLLCTEVVSRTSSSKEGSDPSNLETKVNGLTQAGEQIG
jgi:hypothetical protein